MNDDPKRFISVAAAIICQSTGRMRRKCSASRMSPAAVRSTPSVRTGGSYGMRTNASTSALETANDTAATTTMGAKPKNPNTMPPITGPPIPVIMLTWFATAVACGMRSVGTTSGRADCTQGW